MPLNIGDTLGDYRILELLGVGGMGSVYRVQNVITDREEAMKVLLPDLRSAPDLAERFGREIKIHASLEHPCIASLRTALRLDNQLLMVMELVNGITLEKRLRQSPVEVWQGIDWVMEVLSALSYAHMRGVIHRDIKPANIMITPAGTVKLTDFGIASMTAEKRLTQTGMAIGSLYYMSPEQIQAGEPDARSDLYSLGVTFYEMLSGRRAFEGKSEYELMRAQLEQQPTPLSSLNPGLPDSVVAAVGRSMAKKPEDRFQTAQEFKIALERAKQLISLPGQSGSVPRLETPTPGTATLDPVRIKRMRKELAQYVGPIARILVDRAAKKAVSLQQLYEMLAAEIPKSEDRQSFLANRGR